MIQKLKLSFKMINTFSTKIINLKYYQNKMQNNMMIKSNKIR